MAAKVLIIHLDLGIGGAENLIVQVATTLQDIGCEVALLTSHHDINHCFEETKPNGAHLLPPFCHAAHIVLLIGRLAGCIQVYGDWLPRHVLGKFTASFAILRMLLLAIVAVAWLNTYDMIIIDGVAAPIPLLRLFGHKVIYYCHFPDLVSHPLLPTCRLTHSTPVALYGQIQQDEAAVPVLHGRHRGLGHRRILHHPRQLQ